MKHLMNTLFVTSDDIYLSLENENIVMWREKEVVRRIPLLNLENIIYFGYPGASPALLGECAKRHIGFCFMTQSGRFLARAVGASSGNVLLRKEQYRISDDEARSCAIARNFITGKIYNARTVLMRMARDHTASIDKVAYDEATDDLIALAQDASKAADLDSLRGVEGTAARVYFSLFDSMILGDKKTFSFDGRMKRPPRDPVNATLSFVYVILSHDCASALEAVGLDSYVGFLHRDRPGRESLALDIMEELRSIYADRFVLTLINNRVLTRKDFEWKENGAVWLKDDGRKALLTKWQERKREEIRHPFLDEKIQWGLVPFAQAMLLARFIRGDLDEYPPFFWK